MKFSSSAISRRGFLKGLGAATMAMPLLPSLTNPAFAMESDPYKKVVFLVWRHGVAHPLWRPTFSATHQEINVGQGTIIRQWNMQDASLGLYMKGHFDALRDKITMISGVSQLAAVNHSAAVALTASPRGEADTQSSAPDSLDNVLASASTVYPTAPKLDVLRLAGRSSGLMHSFRNNTTVENITQESAFEQLFGSGFGAPEENMSMGPSREELVLRRKKLVVDRSLERYNKILNSAQLSSSDKLVLQQTMEGLYELQTSLQNRLDNPNETIIANACQEFSLNNMDQNEEVARDNINLITQAFACGGTRIAHWQLPSSHEEGSGAHYADNAENRDGSGLYTNIMQRNCKWIADLIHRMDSMVEGNGKTMLENSLIMVTSDMSTSTIGSHPGLDAPFLFAGGLNNTFKMGLYLDFHDWTPEGNLDGRADFLAGKKMRREMHLQGGPPHNELLISVMKGFGLQSSDWERDGAPGFGQYTCGTDSLCDDRKPQSVQKAYVSYYNEVYAARSGNNPGKELPYFRNGD